MATAPKIIGRVPPVDTSTVITPPRARYLSTMSTADTVEPTYEVDGRNRKERRKAESSKRRRRSSDAPQKGIYNAFRGY